MSLSGKDRPWPSLQGHSGSGKVLGWVWVGVGGVCDICFVRKKKKTWTIKQLNNESKKIWLNGRLYRPFALKVFKIS